MIRVWNGSIVRLSPVAYCDRAGLRLPRAFDLSESFWVGLQADYDTAMAKDAVAPELAEIEPLAMALCE